MEGKYGYCNECKWNSRYICTHCYRGTHYERKEEKED